MQSDQVKRSSDNLERCTSDDDVGDDDAAQLSKRTRVDDDVDENVSSNGFNAGHSIHILARAETIPLLDRGNDQPHVFRSSTKSSSWAQVFNRTTSIEAVIDEMNRGPKAKIINDR